jgi:hypothetical protein
MNKEEDKNLKDKNFENFGKLEGTVNTIYVDFDTGEPIIKEKAFAFLLDTDKNGKIIVVYDKNALKLGLIKVGEPLVCVGLFDGTIAVIDSDGNVFEDRRFLCMGIMGNADIDEKELIKQGAIRLR